MRSLLDLMRDNTAVVQAISERCKQILFEASSHLKILDPELGEEELIKSVAAELAKLSQPLRKLLIRNPKS